VRRPEWFLGPLLLGILACQLVGATLVVVLAESHLGPRATWTRSMIDFGDTVTREFVVPPEHGDHPSDGHGGERWARPSTPA
jgi:hypothetical protein